MEVEHMLCILNDVMPQLEGIRLALKDKVPLNAMRGEAHFEAFHTFGGAVGGLRSAVKAIENLNAYEMIERGEV